MINKEELQQQYPDYTKDDIDYLMYRLEKQDKRPKLSRDEKNSLAEKRRQIREEKKIISTAKRIARLSMDAYDINIEKYKKRCNAKQLAYTLTKDEFITLVDSNCIYCGKKGKTIDRIDSKLGYTTENTQSCCYHCNMMKYTFSHEEFINQCKIIATRFSSYIHVR